MEFYAFIFWMSSLVTCAPLPLTLEPGLDEVKIHVFCDTCNFIVDGLRKLFELKLTEDAIAEAALKMCEWFGIEDHYICSKIVPEFKVLCLFEIYL